VKNELLPLPFTLNTGEVKAHIENVVETKLASADEVLFISHEFPGQEAFNQWLIKRMEESGFTTKLETPNLYYVLIFRRPPSNREAPVEVQAFRRP